MSDPGAYPDDMGIFSRLTDEDLDRLFAGHAPAGDDDLRQLAERLNGARYALMASPDQTTTELHLDQIARAVTDRGRSLPASETLPARDRGRWKDALDRGKRIAATLAAGVVAMSASMVGLAYAGVDLPGTAAERAIEAVLGVELPHQDAPVDTTTPETSEGESAGKSSSDAVHAVIEGTEERGCEFGQAVSDAASSKRRGDGGSDSDPCTKPDHEGNAAEHSAAGKQKAADSKNKAAENKAAGQAKADDNKAAGQAKADENRSSRGGASADHSHEANAGGSGQGAITSEEHKSSGAEAAQDAGSDHAGASAGNGPPGGK